jgi:NADP-dependent 3-hydroxy acid dehydrogenase YdfG
METLIDEFAVNVGGALVAAQTVLPSMIKRNGGHIIFTGGGLALDSYPEWTSLSLGKSALRSLAFSLHKEFSPNNVSVGIRYYLRNY